MVKLEQMSDGYYIFKVTIGAITLEKVFMDADKPLEEVSKEPAANGLMLNIPDEYMNI